MDGRVFRTAGRSQPSISRDLSVVRHISSRVATMYLGRIVEMRDTSTLFENATRFYSIAPLALFK